MNHVFIPFHGIGEVYVNLSDMYWYMYDSSFCNLKKEIPFFKLLLDIGSLYMRCHLQLNVTETDIFCHILMDDFRKKSTFLLQSFIRIESVSEDLFCTGDIETLDFVWKFIGNLLIMKHLIFLLSRVMK